MKCHYCKNELEANAIFKGKILPFIADGERKFICEVCVHNQPERLSERDTSNSVSDSLNSSVKDERDLRRGNPAM